MAAPNIVNVTTIIGHTDVLALTTSPTAIVTNGAGSNKVFKINSIIVSNIDGINPADATVSLFRSSVDFRLADKITVPASASLVVLSKDTSIYLEEGDVIRASASAAGDLQCICSYDEIS
jgi:hypothetical protein